MTFKSTKEYRQLSRRAVLWDSMPFSHLNFNGRVVEKYGRDYFNERYKLVTGQFYNEIKREQLDTVDKIVNLSRTNDNNANAQENNDQNVLMMEVPEEYKEIWKNTIPLKYFNDYKERKLLLDSYLRSLSPELQAYTIKTMCLNNASKNYLAFLDLHEYQMTDEQREVFKNLLKFYENAAMNEDRQREDLAKKSLESIEYAAKNEITNNDVTNFLLQHDLLKNDLDYIKMIEKEKEADIEFFKTNEELANENDLHFKASMNNLNAGLLRDQFKPRETASPIDPNVAKAYEDYLNAAKNAEAAKNAFQPRNNYQQTLPERTMFSPNHQNHTDVLNNVNKLINDNEQLMRTLNSLNLSNPMLNKSTSVPNYQANTIFGNQTKQVQQNVNNANPFMHGVNPQANNYDLNQYKDSINKNIKVSRYDYKDYVKTPNAYNIVDLIYNRELKEDYSRQIVDQIVSATIQVNNQYTKAALKTPINTLSNEVYQTQFNNPNNQDIFNNPNNKPTNVAGSNPDTPISLAQLRSKSIAQPTPQYPNQTNVNSLMQPTQSPNEPNNNLPIVKSNRTASPFDLSSPNATRTEINLKQLTNKNNFRRNNQNQQNATPQQVNYMSRFNTPNFEAPTFTPYQNYQSQANIQQQPNHQTINLNLTADDKFNAQPINAKKRPVNTNKLTYGQLRPEPNKMAISNEPTRNTINTKDKNANNNVPTVKRNVKQTEAQKAKPAEPVLTREQIRAREQLKSQKEAMKAIIPTVKIR